MLNAKSLFTCTITEADLRLRRLQRQQAGSGGRVGRGQLRHQLRRIGDHKGLIDMAIKRAASIYQSHASAVLDHPNGIPEDLDYELTPQSRQDVMKRGSKSVAKLRELARTSRGRLIRMAHANKVDPKAYLHKSKSLDHYLHHLANVSHFEGRHIESRHSLGGDDTLETNKESGHALHPVSGKELPAEAYNFWHFSAHKTSYDPHGRKYGTGKARKSAHINVSGTNHANEAKTISKLVKEHYGEALGKSTTSMRPRARQGSTRVYINRDSDKLWPSNRSPQKIGDTRYRIKRPTDQLPKQSIPAGQEEAHKELQQHYSDMREHHKAWTKARTASGRARSRLSRAKRWGLTTKAQRTARDHRSKYLDAVRVAKDTAERYGVSHEHHFHPPEDLKSVDRGRATGDHIEHLSRLHNAERGSRTYSGYGNVDFKTPEHRDSFRRSLKIQLGIESRGLERGGAHEHSYTASIRIAPNPRKKKQESIVLFRTRLLIESMTTWHALKDVALQTRGNSEKASSENTTTSLGASSERGRLEMNRRRAAGEHDFRVTHQIGSGDFGAVRATDHPDRVVKFDFGGAEGKLAQHIYDNKEEFKHIKSLPKIHSVHQLSFKHLGNPVTAIHREELADLDRYHSSLYRSIGDHIERGMHAASMAHRSLFGTDDSPESEAMKQRLHIRHIGQSLKKFDKDHVSRKHRKAARQVGADMMHLVKRGIYPCDMHSSNWGRRKNGEVVMRDIGCYHVQNPRKG